MSKNIIITIGRELGSGGREIAKKLSERLEIGYYDKNLIDLIAEESGMSPHVLHQADEKPSHPFLSAYMVGPGEYTTINDRMYWAQTAVIKDLAQEESFVIVGRCANYILRDREDALHVFIYGSLDERIKRIKDRYMLTSDDLARKEIIKTDKQRRAYYQYYTDWKWGTKEGMDLLIDSTFFGIDNTVDMIVRIVEERWPDYNKKILK